MAASPLTFALTALLLPAASFLVIGLLPPLRRSGRLAALLSIACALGALAAAVLGWTAVDDMSIARVPWLPGVHGPLSTVGVMVDPQSATMLLLVTLVSLLVQIYSLGYLSDEPRPALGRYYAFQSLFAFSMMGVVLAPNLLQLFVCWELVGVCSYLLIGFWYRKPEAARAALKAFWITKAGDVGLLVGIVLLYGATGTFDLMQLRFLADNGRIPLAGLGVITFCIYLGAMGKSAQFPLHVWLPDAMEGPTPVSALIHAATMVTAGVYLLTRLDWLFALTPQVLSIVAWNGALTALLAAILACVQTDIKRVLAYSTVSQLGYMMAAIGAGFAPAGFLHLLTHGVFKALLFLGAGAIIHAVHTNEITAMGGLGRRMPQTLAVFLVGTLSLAGVPVFAGFVSKEEVLAAVWTGGFPVPFAMLLLAAFLTAFYMFRVVFLVFFATDPRPSHLDPRPSPLAPRPSGHAHDPHPVMALPLWILAIAALAIGITFTIRPPQPEPEFHAPAWAAPAAIAVALGGIVLAWLTYQRRAISADTLAAAFAPIRRAALARFWLDDLYAAIYRSILLALSRLVGWIDRYLVDGVLNVISAWTLDGGDALRRMQTGKVQDYVFALGFGLLALIVWMGVSW
ncbi:MAG TPA: NADH-quinone oxidoreductase subunit L [Vicinamibacterales bacterium]|nr:NADH-quinone oxidoreductase subunit L [Vicinamibacterales bacterium]